MNDLTLDALLNQINTHFQEKEYALALERAAWGAQQFPEALPDLNYTRMCAAARLNDKTLLFHILRETLDAGIWYSEFVFRATPSFQGLQGDPEFEELIQTSVRLQAEVGTQPPPPLVVAPDEAQASVPVLLTLHGNSSSVGAEAGFWRPAVAKGWMLAMPESSQAHWKGHHIWDDQELAMREVQAFYKALGEQHPIDHERIVMAGFSLGARVALELALSGTIPARGFVTLAPYLPDAEVGNALLAQCPRDDLLGCIFVDEADPSFPNILTFVDALRARGMRCELETFAESGHLYPSTFAQRLVRALDFVG